MKKPILFAVDDDPEVLRAVERDLRRQYGERYRVMRASSGASALQALERLKLRNEPVALLLVDQRMPRMSGVELFEQAIPLFPEAKRVLLTAYAETDAAIAAINKARIDYYLLKPWDPPEQCLYPVVGDLLDDWQASYRPPFEGVRVIGHRWSPRAFQVRDFLARRQVPYRWLDVEAEEEARSLLDSLRSAGGNGNGAAAGGPAREAASEAAAEETGREADEAMSLPVVLFADGTHASDPPLAELAERLGLRTRAENPFYDLVIVGGGPAGLAAAVYGASEGLRTLMVESYAPGGQAGTSSRIENYLGFPSGLSGADLARRAVTQAARFGVEILAPQDASTLRLEEPYRVLGLASGAEVTCHALLVATGVSYRKLEVPGIERLTGAGVYYGAAMTEAMDLRGEEVYIVGGANSAGQAAIFFARYASKVIMLVRGGSLNKEMSQYLVDQICGTPAIEVRFHRQVVEAHGDVSLAALSIADSASGHVDKVPARSLFILIGAVPHTGWLEGVVERDAHGFVLAGPDLMREGQRPRGWPLDRDPFLLETSVPGVFVAGDVRHGSVKRVASSVGEGSIAISFVHQYMSQR
ncbi:MAG TPA: FAD-dependent oxidoreductase [Thermoanaerobaculia bacterium]|nr:FAD-dependent oxidoreductase [Thermoanaerobaculia bacterium]